MWSGVVDRRRPNRVWGNITPALPLRHSMPYCVQIDRSLSRPGERRIRMDNENETETELVTETLVEEVSIDGMCGVY
jgi:mycofactocin precursor peptide MftA